MSRAHGLVVLALLAGLLPAQTDPRTLYDVETYRLDLEVVPQTKTLLGTVAIAARTLAPLAELELDLVAALEVTEVLRLQGEITPQGSLAGSPLAFRHEGNRLVCRLDAEVPSGEELRLAVVYRGQPRSESRFDGFHWAKTKDGKPWIGTSCQNIGAHTWWPCKASLFHPEDKPARLFVNATVPKGLFAVSNGRLTGRSNAANRRETFHWVHPYPLETYSVTLNVAPYVVTEDTLKLDGIEAPVPFITYILPENVEKAKLQFRDVPELLAIYGRAFGPFPFPDSKFALVETSFWGMEHSTAVAYGSSYPAWCEKHGKRDRYASRNGLFDYILVHEVAHEWWGNAVSARDWGDFWIHEGFGTYAEGVYVEHRYDRATADGYFTSIARRVSPRTRLFRGRGVAGNQAYAPVIYYKGACVLNTMRHVLNDDATWWALLRDFNLAWRYKNAGTDDFRAMAEAKSGRDWKRFFDEWVYGTGYPELEGRVTAATRQIRIEVTCATRGGGEFHVPLDLVWTERGVEKQQRVELAPGANRLIIPCAAQPRDLAVVGLDRILGRHDVAVK